MTNPRLCKPSPPRWTLHIEGKLLIDHLDHQSAQWRDIAKNTPQYHPSSDTTTAAATATAAAADPMDQSSSPVQVPLKFTHLFNQVVVTFQTNYIGWDPKMKSTTTTTSSSSSHTNTNHNHNHTTSTSTKNQKKSRRQHAMDSQTSTTSQSDIVSSGSTGTTIKPDTKEPKNSTSTSSSNYHNSDNHTHQEYKSKRQQVIWNLPPPSPPGDGNHDPNTTTTSSSSESTTTANTTGADLWSFVYTEPTVTPEFKLKYKVHSVVAVVELYRRYNYDPIPTSSMATTTTTTANTTTTTTVSPPPTSTTITTTTTRYYRILSSLLQTLLFPHHGPVTNDILTGAAPIHHNSSTSQQILDQLLSSTHNQVHIPQLLTIQEIIHTFFVYIQDHHLILPNDDGSTNGDVVQCDTILQQLLNMEQFSFSELRTLLHQRQLIEPVMNHMIHGGSMSISDTNHASSQYDPVRITYIMEQEGASTSLIPQLTNNSTTLMNKNHTSANDTSNLSCLQIDMDIFVPHYMMYRLYKLLQRLKVREQEYVSCRTKGRLRLQRTLPSNPSQNDGTAMNMSSTNMTAQARRLAQQAILTAREDDERHVRTCIEEYIQQQQQQQSSSSLSDSHNNDHDKHHTNVTKDSDLIPFVPLTLAQCAVMGSEAQTMYQLDSRIEYLLQQLESPVVSNVVPHRQEIQTFLNHIFDGSKH